MYTQTINFFNPANIARSGQAFRIHIIDSTHVETVAHGQYLQIADLGDNRFAFSCTPDEFESVWRAYFDLDRDYENIVSSINPNDSYLRDAASFGHGIRILKQDIFETVISYIISQRRSIPSITTCVDRLCELCGAEITLPDLSSPFVPPLKEHYYAFPTPEAICSRTAEAVNKIGSGYRTAYILSVARDFAGGKLIPQSMEMLDSDTLFRVLTEIYGVGTKVANCIMLFAFARTERFPIDVWIKRILDRYYGGHFDISDYPQTAGIMQQFMFYYERCEPTHHASIKT